MNNIEKCQNIGKKSKENSSITCYNGDGILYNGTVNITSTGKTCLPWNINPFLSSRVYSNLINNYCRNPQGYATAPWCYVNATNRDWEYCDVPKCTQNDMKGKKSEKDLSITCYNGDGILYNGTVNITSTGKTCLPWNINPFLSSPVYSKLKNNYCRNPQGYATAPWCYVNATNRDWEYCDVSKCTQNDMKVKYKEVLIVGLVLIFTFAIVLSIWKICRIRKNKTKDNIDPYNVCSASDQEITSQLLRLPSLSEN
ncbi:plasminogen-like [Hydractinia symbiolongicarpus]|uniref:plasminogen-like n=1 Tax=Hydractinia symbiolongicarpus TaxID=13093 RepID=UPI0025508C0A|nr:plasminogen-like [Hydractinia symbiolongicarpus]